MVVQRRGAHVDLLIALDDVDPMLSECFGPEQWLAFGTAVAGRQPIFKNVPDRVQLGDHVSEHG